MAVIPTMRFAEGVRAVPGSTGAPMGAGCGAAGVADALLQLQSGKESLGLRLPLPICWVKQRQWVRTFA